LCVAAPLQSANAHATTGSSPAFFTPSAPFLFKAR
jgi:hypothetical protein